MIYEVGPVDRDVASAEFFDGTARGEFRFRRSKASGRAAEPHVERCRETGSSEMEWETATGDATLVSWTVSHGRGRDGEPIRQVFGIGQLAEGPWWWSRIVDLAPEDAYEGMPLRIVFGREEGHEAVPLFVRK